MECLAIFYVEGQSAYLFLIKKELYLYIYNVIKQRIYIIYNVIKQRTKMELLQDFERVKD